MTQAVERVLGVRSKGQRGIVRSVTAADAERRHSSTWSEAKSPRVQSSGVKRRERDAGAPVFMNRAGEWRPPASCSYWLSPIIQFQTG